MIYFNNFVVARQSGSKVLRSYLKFVSKHKSLSCDCVSETKKVDVIQDLANDLRPLLESSG